MVENVIKLEALTFQDKKEAQVKNFFKMSIAIIEDIRVLLVKLV
ncbi:hypothetical protein [Candidatus Gillettellia adelgis]